MVLKRGEASAFTRTGMGARGKSRGRNVKQLAEVTLITKVSRAQGGTGCAWSSGDQPSRKRTKARCWIEELMKKVKTQGSRYNKHRFCAKVLTNETKKVI